MKTLIFDCFGTCSKCGKVGEMTINGFCRFQRELEVIVDRNGEARCLPVYECASRKEVTNDFIHRLSTIFSLDNR